MTLNLVYLKQRMIDEISLRQLQQPGKMSCGRTWAINKADNRMNGMCVLQLGVRISLVTGAPSYFNVPLSSSSGT